MYFEFLFWHASLGRIWNYFPILVFGLSSFVAVFDIIKLTSIPNNRSKFLKWIISKRNYLITFDPVALEFSILILKQSYSLKITSKPSNPSRCLPCRASKSEMTQYPLVRLHKRGTVKEEHCLQFTFVFNISDGHWNRLYGLITATPSIRESTHPCTDLVGKSWQLMFTTKISRNVTT